MEKADYSFTRAGEFLNKLSKFILSLFLLLVVSLFFDSRFMVRQFEHTQLFANIIIGIVFLLIYQNETKKNRTLMLIAVVISIFGECLFSLVLEMYTYRLHNVPLYVFPGHAIVYIAVSNFCKAPAVKKYSTIVTKCLFVSIALYAFSYFIFYKDTFGFVLTLFTLYFLRNRPNQRLFYMTMYMVVVFLEQVGTSYQCWYWPETAWNTFPFLKSANPPSGISFFYFGLDLGCLYIYKTIHSTAWLRMKNIRAMK